MQQPMIVLEQWLLDCRKVHDTDIFLDKLTVSINGKHRKRYKVSAYEDKKQFVQIIFKTFKHAFKFYKSINVDVKHTTIYVNF